MGWNSVDFSQVIIEGGITGSGLFVYSGVPGPGDLIVTISAGGGTDPYGNVYPAGVAIFDGELSIYDPAIIRFPSGASFENNIAFIGSSVLGTSPAQFIQLVLSGASTTTAGARDLVFVEFNSAADNNSSDANMEFVYQGSNGNEHEYAFMDGTGFNIVAGAVTAVHPGSSPAIAESMQSATAGSSWTGTVFYRATPDGCVEITAQLTAPAAAVNNVTIVTLPAGYRPTTGVTFGVQQNSGSNAGFGFVMTLASTGVLTSQGVTASSTVWVGPIRIPLSL